MEPLLKRKLLFILHRALTEADSLKGGGNAKQILALTDATEKIPALMMKWKPHHLDIIARGLKLYEDQFPHGVKYARILDLEDFPEDS